MPWWSAPAGGPQPSAGIHVSPSSLLTELRLQPLLKVATSDTSWETTVIPVSLSLNRIGSNEAALVSGGRLAQVAVAGEAVSSNVMKAASLALPTTAAPL